MNVTLLSPVLRGEISAISSKSEAHRLLIAAALSDRETHIVCPVKNDDIERTAECLSALGARISYDGGIFAVTPISAPVLNGVLPVGESGSTLRFLVPVVAALGCGATFLMRGRLPSRPMQPLLAALEKGGVMAEQKGDALTISGKLLPMEYAVRADISSQFISGLLFALPLVRGATLLLVGQAESTPYIDMTKDTLQLFGVSVTQNGDTLSVGDATYQSPGNAVVGGDYSNAAFFLAAGAIGDCPVTVTGLSPETKQGDRAVLRLLSDFGASVTEENGRVTVSRGSLRGIPVDARDIPDLVPILAVVASFAEGETVFTGISRLRAKESDRVASVTAMLSALGGDCTAEEDTLTVRRARLTGGSVSSAGDHRIAMAAAIAATAASGAVTVEGAEAVNKSYPHFFDDMKKITVKGEIVC